MSTSNRSIPGPKSRRLMRRLQRVESRNITYASPDFPVFWDSARGSYVRDVDGHEYLDLSSAFAVTSLGHGDPKVARALQDQARRMWHGMGDIHPNAVKVELLELLARLAPRGLSVSILSSTGSEAVESALKTARLYTGRPGVIAFEGAYHGLSYGNLPVTHRRDFKDPFTGQWNDFAVHLRFPEPLRRWPEAYALEAVERALRDGTRAGAIGAILIEPVQGRGGVRVASAAFLKGLQKLAQRHRALLIADEVFTGFGRTGRRFAVDHAKVIPDLLCVGKAMANGFPISACIGRPNLMAAWPASDGEAIHTSTFLGNPLGCAMALASLKEIEKRDLAARAAVLGTWWRLELAEELADHPRVAEVRGLGLMIGIELVQDRTSLMPDPVLAAQVVTEALKKKLIILSGGNLRNVLTLTPPLIVSRAELSEATKKIKEILQRAARETN